MAAVQIADGVWRLPLGPQDWLNGFLLQGDDGTLTLVDAGTRGAARKVLQGLASLGRQPGDVSHLPLSHAHNDHTGGAAKVQRATGSRVATHADEASWVRSGRMPPPDPSTRGGRLLASDAVFDVRGLRYPFKSSCTDVTASRASAVRLGELDYGVAGFAHGPHVSTGAQAAVRAFLAGRPC